MFIVLLLLLVGCSTNSKPTNVEKEQKTDITEEKEEPKKSTITEEEAKTIVVQQYEGIKKVLFDRNVFIGTEQEYQDVRPELLKLGSESFVDFFLKERVLAPEGAMLDTPIILPFIPEVRFELLEASDTQFKVKSVNLNITTGDFNGTVYITAIKNGTSWVIDRTEYIDSTIEPLQVTKDELNKFLEISPEPTSLTFKSEEMINGEKFYIFEYEYNGVKHLQGISANTMAVNYEQDIPIEIKYGKPIGSSVTIKSNNLALDYKNENLGAVVSEAKEKAQLINDFGPPQNEYIDEQGYTVLEYADALYRIVDDFMLENQVAWIEIKEVIANKYTFDQVKKDLDGFNSEFTSVSEYEENGVYVLSYQNEGTYHQWLSFYSRSKDGSNVFKIEYHPMVQY
jgi:hypothetical protein